MSDVEDDFFGLADGQVLSSDGESDGEDVRETRERSPSRSPTPKRRESSPKSVRKGTAVKKAKRRKGTDESEEDGEASDAPGSPNSLDSAPMDESDSDVEAPSRPAPPQVPATTYADDDDEEDKYPIDGLFSSEQEKDEIMAMQMLDREQIIAERSAEVERRRQNRLLRQLVSNQESEEKKHKKRKASSADLEDEDGARKPTRVRTKSTAAAAGTSMYDDLRRARAERNDRIRVREEERQKVRRDNRRPNSRQSDFSDDDQYESHRRHHSRTKSPEPSYSKEPATLRDIEHVRVGRSNFGQICFYPGFDSTIHGCFCRVSIGPDKNNQPTYKMAVIKEIVKGKPYALQYRSQQIVTDQYAVLAHGKAVREWPFLMLSDSRFTEAEFNLYKQVCAADGIAIPKRQTLINKVDELDALIKREFTPLELQQKLDRHNALKRRFIPVDKDRLRRDLEDARAAGDENGAAKIQEKLDGADAPRLAFRTSLQVTKRADNAQQEKLAELNRRNRRANVQEVRAAQLREKHKMRALEEALERGEDVQIDQSRRLKTKAKFVHDVGEKDALLNKVKGGAGAAGAATAAGGIRPGTPKTSAKEKEKVDVGTTLAMERLRQKQQEEAMRKGMPTLSRPITGDDVIGALDLDIDIEI